MVELWLFLRAVAHHWATLVTGGFVMALVLVAERWTDKNVPGWSFWLLIGAFLAWAFFLAWRDEHRRRVAAEAKAVDLQAELDRERALRRPQLSGSIDRMGLGESAQFGAGAFLILSIRNNGAPSIVETWSVTVKTHQRGMLRGQLLATPGTFTLGQGPGAWQLNQADLIYEKTLTPIPQGGRVTGWLGAAFGDVPRGELWCPGVVWTVSFADSTGAKHQASWAVSGNEPSNFTSYYPGAGGRIVLRDSASPDPPEAS